MRVIVNADDMGMSESVNEATVELISSGLVTSTSLLANGPAFPSAVKMLRDRKNCSVGVHLNLIEFTPLTRHPGLQRLLASDGTFRNIIRRTLPAIDLQKGIYAEWCRQIERVLEAGISPSHLDSHQHVHTLPQLSPIVRRLQKEFRIRRVRRTKSIYAPRTLRTGAVWAWRSFLNTSYSSFANPITTREFTDVHAFLAARDRLSVNQTAEVMIHAWVPKDVQVLRSEAWAQLVERHTLIRFDELQ